MVQLNRLRLSRLQVTLLNPKLRQTTLTLKTRRSFLIGVPLDTRFFCETLNSGSPVELLAYTASLRFIPRTALIFLASSCVE
jgi:hypothetical protein